MNLLRSGATRLVANRGVTVAPPCLRQLSHTPHPAPASQALSRRTPSSSRNASKRHDSAQQGSESVAKDGDSKDWKDQKAGRKASRKTSFKTASLRRVVAEAQQSRKGFVRGRGSKRFVDPDADTKTVTAYCAAEQYNIAAASQLIQSRGYQLDPCQTGLFPQVIHVQMPTRPSEVKDLQDRGDIFVFPSGTVVTWNVRDGEALDMINCILPAAAEGLHLEKMESENLEYLEDSSRNASEVVGDTIVLGTKMDPQDADAAHDGPKEPADADHRPDVDTVLVKIAFSSGLARSTKLAVLESLLSSYQYSTRRIPTTLARGEGRPVGRKALPFTRSFVLRKTGELLSIRAQLNLYNELTDSLPDIFWDSRHELGLGEYYEQVGRALDVNVRIRTLNEKISFAKEIASVLMEALSEKHSLRLEWAVITLIAVEVVLEMYRHWKDGHERDDPDSTEAVLRQYLKKAS